LARELMDADLPREARLLLDKAVFEYPQDAALAQQWALASWRDPDSRSGALARFREAEALADLPTASFQQGFAECLIQQGRADEAESRLQQAIKSFAPEQRAETARALRTLAGLWQRQERNEAAARALRRRAESLGSE
jgi:tetratricopeptide (TPR) repeat protein